MADDETSQSTTAEPEEPEELQQGAEEKPEPPQRWVWADMDPVMREERLTELVIWVDWLLETYDLRNQVARCWYRHPRLIEHFTALFAGWVRTYAGDPTQLSTRAEVDWIKELYAMVPRLNSASCQNTHVEPPPTRFSMRHAFDEYLAEEERPFLDADRSHPAKAQINRMAKTKRLAASKTRKTATERG